MAGFLDSLGGLSGIGSALSGVGNFIGSMFGNGRPSLSAQLDVSKQMAKYQHDLNMDAWREQNAYNDPSAQMQRLKDAGINPHSIAGNASVSGNASGVPATQVDTPDLSNFQRKIDFSALQDAIQGVTNILSAKKDLEYKDVLIQKEKTQTNNIEQATRNAVTQELLMQRDIAMRDFDLKRGNWEMFRDRSFFNYDLTAKSYGAKQAKSDYDYSLRNLARIDREIYNLGLQSAEIISRTDYNKKQAAQVGFQNDFFWALGINPSGDWKTQVIQRSYEIAGTIMHNVPLPDGIKNAIQDYINRTNIAHEDYSPMHLFSGIYGIVKSWVYGNKKTEYYKFFE